MLKYEADIVDVAAQPAQLPVLLAGSLRRILCFPLSFVNLREETSLCERPPQAETLTSDFGSGVCMLVTELTKLPLTVKFSLTFEVSRALRLVLTMIQLRLEPALGVLAPSRASTRGTHWKARLPMLFPGKRMLTSPGRSDTSRSSLRCVGASEKQGIEATRRALLLTAQRSQGLRTV
jgi:hypothetical protein